MSYYGPPTDAQLAEARDATLNFVNEFREAIGLGDSVVTALLPGWQTSASGCPISHSIQWNNPDIKVLTRSGRIIYSGKEYGVPAEVTNFVIWFDRGYYPDLITSEEYEK